MGIRTSYDVKDAMITNSLFLDYMKKQGLDIWKDSFTKDIICVNFNYGLSSAQDELKNVKNALLSLKTL